MCSKPVAPTILVDCVGGSDQWLADWVHVQLEHGGDDIPVLGGINFNPA